jgi:hypothetical protein
MGSHYMNARTTPTVLLLAAVEEKGKKKKVL